MKIIKTVFTGNGEANAELMLHHEMKEIRFRQYFEECGFISLDFENVEAILKFLDEHCKDIRKYFIFGDDIVFQEKETDRILTYFGTIL